MHGGQTTLGGANVSQMPLVQNGIGDVLLCSPRWSIGLHHQLAAAQTHPKQHLMLALARWGEATAHKNTMLLGREGNLIGLFSPQNPSCECSQCIQENIYKGLEEEVSEFCLSHGFPCRDRVHLRQRLLDEEKKNSKPLTNRKFRSRHASRQLLVVGACLSGDPWRKGQGQPIRTNNKRVWTCSKYYF